MHASLPTEKRLASLYGCLLVIRLISERVPVACIEMHRVVLIQHLDPHDGTGGRTGLPTSYLGIVLCIPSH
jgi:hypothetical protein